MVDAHVATRVSYSAIQSHVSRGKPLGASTLRKLALWDSRISVAKTLGVES